MTASFIDLDLKTVFSPKVFGEDVLVIWNATTIEGAIFDDEDITVVMGEGVGEIISQPMVTAPTKDFIGIKTDDPIQVNGETMYIKNWLKDGTGVIEIFLERRVI